MMRAIAITQHGGPSALEVTTLPTPPLGPHSVAIRVAAAGVNHVDIDVRRGVSGVESLQSLPHVPGVDCADTSKTDPLPLSQKNPRLTNP
jgi:NADPH:quinone reductase-like Zn-dependent oxidoreductase